MTDKPSPTGLAIVICDQIIEDKQTHKKSLITQREIGFDTLNFQNALKNTLRQAPDVILIGEVRDTETMEAAITFAETGHLCIATLHSNNANQAIERIMNFFPVERHAQIYLQLSLNIRAIISQAGPSRVISACSSGEGQKTVFSGGGQPWRARIAPMAAAAVSLSEKAISGRMPRNSRVRSA